MTPAARISAAIEILDRVLDGLPAEQALLRWSRASRFAGSGDRAAVRDLVFDGLRCRNSLAALGGAITGRGIMIGHLRRAGQDPAAIFTGHSYAPQPLTDADSTPVVSDDVVDLPEWLLPRWNASLGADADAIARAMALRAPVWLRVNEALAHPARAIEVLAKDGVEVQQDARLYTALEVTDGARRISRGQAYSDGLVELQDLSPQLACDALPLKRGDRVLDFCAGGGGKILALAGRQPGLKAVAHDADMSRMRDLPARAERASASVTLTDRPEGLFQLVVADTPCSGSGTWRRTPDAKWRLTQSMLNGLLQLQAQILDEAASFVEVNGHLAFMTCSLLDEENGSQIADFLARRSDFSLVDQSRWTPLTASDGFFQALLRRAK